MPHLSIKDVPEDWVEALRQRAVRHHRSLQGELMAILEQALTVSNLPANSSMALAAAAPEAQGLGSGAPVRRGWLTPEQWARHRDERLRAAGAVVPAQQVSSLTLLREDRDR